MSRLLRPVLVSLVALAAIQVSHSFGSGAMDSGDRAQLRSRAQKLFQQNNFAEAETVYRELALDAGNTDKEVSDDFVKVVECLNRLNRIKEFDELFENVVGTHSSNWRLLARAAATLHQGQVPQHGFLIAGQFERGPHRGGGKSVNSLARDRVRAMQLLVAAIPLMKGDATTTPVEAGDLYRQLANVAGEGRYGESWRLQDLTDLTSLPDYEEGGGFGGLGRGRGLFSLPAATTQRGFGIPFGSDKGAPVDEEGNPIFIRLPESWEAAQTDGERWRWALNEQAEANPKVRSGVDLEWAGFLQSQFGVSSLIAGPAPIVRVGNEDDVDAADHFHVHELNDSETIASLATGTKRFELPDEFNHIAIINSVIERNDDRKREALEMLFSIRMNRHQYPRAAEVQKQILELATDKDDRKAVQQQIDQIVKNWVQFQHVQLQPAGKTPSFEIRYRNGSKISFTAQAIDIEKLIRDTQAYLQSNPERVDYQKTQIEQVGMKVIEGDRKKYLGPALAEWNETLTPPDNHFDAIETVEVPVRKAGAYFITGKIKGGNEARMVIWVADTAITRKRVEAGTLHFVADAVTGAPIARADLEFFGWRQERVGRTRDYRVLTSRFADRTDEKGLCVPTEQNLQRNYRWLTVARTKDGRLAYDGFNGVWVRQTLQPLNYSPQKVYSVTDRPVYRPGHDVKYRLWVRRPRFSQDTPEFANKPYVLQIRDPKGEIVVDRDVKTDRWAGIDGQWSLPDNATLGRYRLIVGTRFDSTRTRIVNGKRETYTEKAVRQIGYGSFQVEEYRKPEFEVTIDAPDKPVMLGEKIQARVNARYYFGAAVTEAEVHYKVERTKKDSRWYPVGRWDWLYSPGYWWFAPDYEWYPGWYRWGCWSPIPIWRGWNPDPPEVVVEGDAKIGPDGTFLIDIDTAAALKEHSDSDHSYAITAEVTDQSRRTIIGNGSVLVARQPFRVFVWTDRGHYRTGDTVNVSLQARTPDGRPVSGAGRVRLMSIHYENEKPVEREVDSWNVRTDENGHAKQKLTIPQAGQYRIAVDITDTEGHTAEGGYVLFVRGNDDDGRSYRFNALELITDKREYQPGETAKLQINTNQQNSTVLLFVRPMNGLCPAPQLISLDGKSKTIDLEIARDDMPNIFVEALTIAEGRIHSEIREIVVPPEKKVANVEVLPSAERYRPGEEATVKLKLTDLNGDPFVGNTVLSVYDASLEYIAASNIPEIRSFFWNVRRRHNISTQSTLDKQTGPIYLPGETVMQILAGDDPAMFGWGGGMMGGMGGGFGGGGFFGGGPGAPMARGRAMPEAAMAMDAEAAPAEGMAVEAKSLSLNEAQNAAAGGNEPAAATVRSNFADTAYWVASVTSDQDGFVEVKFKVPDNLTTWKIKAWTLGEGTRVGSGTSDIISSKDLIIRPQTPRFFTETDLITLSAVVHNYLENEKTATVVLEVEGGQLQLSGDAEQVVQIPADGEVRVDWNVHVIGSGDVKVRMKALTDEESDATELIVPAHVHGILKTESFTGVIRPSQNEASVMINVPAARIEEQSRLEVRFSPTLAGAMVDALPYLIEYPYGCTEQTLNRFLPAAITQQTLLRMGIDLDDVRRKRTNLNAQELGDAAVRAAQWKRYDRNPVFDKAELEVIVRTGVNDLTNMQLSDGGWGWFSGYSERSTPHLTSQVVHGLTVARNNDVPILPEVIARGVAWLKQHQAEELAKLREGDWRRDNPDKLKKRRKPYKMKATNMDAFVSFVLAEHDGSDPAMTEYLYRDRGSLSVYGLSLTGLVLDFQKDAERRDMVLRNIEQFLVVDDENQTAYLNIPQSSWWYWYGSDNESMSRYLQLLLKANPNSETAPRLVKYLLNNRKHGTYWRSTRDTALVVEALADYLRATGEDKPNMTVEVLVDGTLQKKVNITAENLFSFDNVMLLQGDTVKTGMHKVEIRRSGSGPVYFNAYLTNFTKENPITAAGLEVKVERRFYRLERDDKDVSVQGDRGHVVKQAVARYKRIPLQNLDSVASGDLVEVEMIVDSKNDYEYLLLEDRKPSGFETDDQRSGYIYEGLRAYRELRDDRVSFFLSNLARGRHSVSYRIRAESPSERVSALPSKIEGMYAPELVGNSDEFKLRVGERPEQAGN